VDAQRKADCRGDLKRFCETYRTEVFSKPWSDDHLQVIAAMQEAILSGGKFALAMPRGSGKTTLTEAAALWALLYGHSRYCCIIGATVDAGQQLLESIKTVLETSETLAEDFPEACYPIQCLEGITKRCKGQLLDGERTHISWLASRLIFPTVPGSPCSSAVLTVRGITSGGIRGQKHTTPAGDQVRPDLVILDDPQDDESAASPTQNEKRERIVNGAVLGMAGPGNAITAIMPCTIIQRGDLAARFLDRERNPEWNGIVCKLMQAMPKADALWEDYFALRREDLSAGRGIQRANDFYTSHQTKMDAGAIPSWPERFEKTERSAIQHAMHLLDRDAATFAAEYQNDPLDPDASDVVMVQVDQVVGKTHHYRRHRIPNDTEMVVGFVDVQLRLLYYGLAAMKKDFTGHVHDYGTWPKQPTKYFIYGPKVANSIQRQKTSEGVPLGTLGEEAQIRQALERLINDDLMQRTWLREDGTEFQIDLLLIDMGWQDKVVKQFIRESPYRARLLPSKGKGVRSGDRKISETPQRPGVEIGDEWILPKATGRKPLRQLHHDANYWKSLVQSRWLSPIGQPGCLTLFKAKAIEHRMIAEHCTAETAKRKEGKTGDQVDEWKLKVGRDNHLLDCIVGCHVAASRKGAAVPNTETKQATKQRGGKKMKLSELQRQKRLERR